MGSAVDAGEDAACLNNYHLPARNLYRRATTHAFHKCERKIQSIINRALQTQAQFDLRKALSRNRERQSSQEGKQANLLPLISK